MSEVAVEYEPPAPRTVQWFGQTWEIADKIGLMPLMRFAHLARSGADSNDMEALAAMYDLLQQCFTDEAWGRFQAVAARERAGGDELFGVVKEVMAVMSARPTGRPSGSSGGSQHTSRSSVGASSSPADVLAARGRPDLGLIVEQAEQFTRDAASQTSV